ncbi:hypothetical protein AgCh_000322 [Apium graveolens]
MSQAAWPNVLSEQSILVILIYNMYSMKERDLQKDYTLLSLAKKFLCYIIYEQFLTGFLELQRKGVAASCSR